MKKGFIYFCVLMVVVSFVACGKSDEALVNDISTSNDEDVSVKEDNIVDLENLEEEVDADMDLEAENDDVAKDTSGNFGSNEVIAAADDKTGPVAQNPKPAASETPNPPQQNKVPEENPKTQNTETNSDTNSDTNSATNPDTTKKDNKNKEDAVNSNAETITETIPESINETTPESITLKLIINGTQVPVTWENNAAIEEMKEQVKQEDIVVAMSPYGGFEQVGSLGRSYTRNDVQTTTSSGDIVLYSGNQIVVFYGSNSWSYTRLGKMGISEDEAKNLLSGSAVSLRITK